MDSSRYQQAKGIFFATLELPAAEREAFIGRSCGRDLELQAALRRLIRAHENAVSFLSDPPVSLGDRSRDENQPRFQPGMLLAGRFQILRFIASGGMGEVYEAEDLELHVRVALKTIRAGIADNEKILELFKHEIQLARRVTHPNVCRIFDLSRHSETDPEGREQAVHFLSMELLDGQSLSQYLKEHGPFGAAEAMPLIEQMAAALQAAHDAGVIHRDFKPGNVILAPRGMTGDLRAVVTDFGLAFPSVESDRRGSADSGQRGGTPGYMAPEQSHGGIVTTATDVYSFGRVIAEMIGGKRAEERRSLLSAWMPASERDHAVSLRIPDSCAGWRPVLDRCVELQPERRFQKPVDVAATLRATDPRKAWLRWLSRPALVERRSTRGTMSRRWRWAALSLTMGLAAAVTFALRWWPQVPPPSVTQTVQLTSNRHPKWFRLVTDGARIYFSERERNRWILAAVPTQGGEYAEIPTPFRNTVVQDISPTGTELLVTASEQEEFREPLAQETPLWVISTEGGKAHRLGELEILEARWSADGTRLLFIRGKDVYVAKSDGTGSRKLVSMSSPPYFSSWSPDGKRLSLSVADPVPSLWELNADGSNLHRKLAGWGGEPFDCNGTWTPDGKYFLFDSFRGGPDSIWALRERGSWFERWSREPMRLSSGPMSAGKPVASKDGRRIFFLGDTGKRSQLSRYDARSGDWSPFLSGISAEQVDFSRDGQWVAYTSILGPNLVRSRMDGSQRLQLTFPPVEAANPRWSPDGKKIAFMARHPGKSWKIRAVLSDGGSLEPLMPGESDERDPGWSPDGNSLVFVSDREFQKTSDPPWLFVLDLRTRRVNPVPASTGLLFPRWSPDGRFLAAISVNYANVVLFDFRKRQWVELASGAEFYWPSWSQDSQFVYFIDWKTESGVYDRVRIRDHKRERVAKLDKDLAVDIFHGGWVGLTPDGAPLALIVESAAEIFAFDWRAP